MANMSTTPLVPFGSDYMLGTHRCEGCEERDAVGSYGDAYSCQECYDEAEAPYREIERLRAEVEELKVRDILTRNPGIDADEVRRFRASGHR